jgi:hypothetical protein
MKFFSLREEKVLHEEVVIFEKLDHYHFETVEMEKPIAELR